MGVSLDGPKEIHDCYRYYDDGRGTFSDVTRGINILRMTMVPFGVLSVVSDKNVALPENLYEFYIKNGFNSVAFNHCKGIYRGENFVAIVKPKEYANFLIRFFDLWLEKDNPNLQIRQLKGILHGLLGGSYKPCIYSGDCTNFLIINYDGTVLSCDSEGTNELFNFGNIMDGIKSITEAPNYRRYKELIQKTREKCFRCKWFKICGGGCTKDYYLKDFSSTNYRNTMCAGLQMVYQHVSERLIEFGIL